MTTIATKTNPLRKFAKLLLVLPFLGLLAFGTPSALADDHHRKDKNREHHDGGRHNDYRRNGDGGRHYRHSGRGERHRGYHRVRHWRYRDGRRVYYYVNEPYYYYGPGVSLRIGF